MKKKLYYLNFTFAIIFAVMLCFSISACSTPATKLPAPSGFELIGRTVKWSEVPNASGYILKLNDDEAEIKEACYVLSNSLQAGEYTLEVMAYGDFETYTDSEWTTFSFVIEEQKEPDINDEPIEPDVDDKPIAHGFDEAGFEYTLMDDGQGYEVYRGTANLVGEIEIPAYFKGLPVVKISDNAFMNEKGEFLPNPATGGLCNIVTTGVTIPDTVTEIGEFSFACMRELKQLTIPDSVTKIGRSAIWGCNAMNYVTLPKGLKKIPDNCFEDCALSEIIFPDGLEEIGDYAFSSKYYPLGDRKKSDQSFTKIDVPNTVNRIGSRAFYGCEELKDIKLPNEFNEFGSNAFLNTAWLDSQPNGLVTIGNVLYEYKGDMAEGTKITVPSGIRYLAGWCFVNQTNLTEIVIPDGVKLVGRGCFNNTSLKKIRLPADMTEIPTETFLKCESLEAIEIPSGVTEIADEAFKDCYKLVEVINKSPYITVEKGSTANGYVGYYALGVYNSGDAFTGTKLSNDNGYTIYADGTEKILVGYTGGETDLNIPSYVTKIHQYAFHNCGSITSVVIPNSVTSIGEYAFYNCDSLEEVMLPEGITSIGESTFDGCKNLTEIVLPDSVTSIGKNAFHLCKSLTKIVLPDSVTSIGNNAFHLCSSLTEIVIPDNVTTIGRSAFLGCLNLTKIVIPSSVTVIGDFAFSRVGDKLIYYKGTEEDYNNIELDGYGAVYDKVTTMYYYSESEPELNSDGSAYDGNYWRYVDGVPTPWVKP